MRRLLIATGLLAGVCVLSLVCAGGAEQAKETTPESGPSDLKAAVADLTKRVAALEKMTQQLEASRRSLVISPGALPAQKPIPKDWQQREINGWTYYIVPLGEK